MGRRPTISRPVRSNSLEVLLDVAAEQPSPVKSSPKLNLTKLTIPTQQHPFDSTTSLASSYYSAHESFSVESPGTLVWQTAVECKPGWPCYESHGALSAPSAPAPALVASAPTPSAPVAPAAAPAVKIPTTDPGSSRGISQATATSPTVCRFAPTRVRAGSASVSTSAPRSQKKAVLIGLNYTRFGKKGRLDHAAQDAHRFADTLPKLGYSNDNIKVVTDEEGQRFPSYEYLMECMDWLVQDVSAGDHLFFMFSGHCEPPMIGKPEPYLVAADMTGIPRSTFQENLVAKIPTGAELTIVLDCCNAAGMVKLEYCVGRMDYGHEATQIPQHKSLHGVSAVSHKIPRFPMQSTPIIINAASYGAPVAPVILRRRSVVAGRPLLLPVDMPTQTPLALMPSMTPRTQGTCSSPAMLPASTNPRNRRQLVVAGRPLPHFEQRDRDFVAPAGKVLVWAGTGERQKAFESAGAARNGIVTDAFCSVFETCMDRVITHRDLWQSIVGAVDKENSWRSERDAKKAKKPPKSVRVQCAELWVSQQEPLSSSSPMLDQAVYWKSG